MTVTNLSGQILGGFALSTAADSEPLHRVLRCQGKAGFNHAHITLALR